MVQNVDNIWYEASKRIDITAGPVVIHHTHRPIDGVGHYPIINDVTARTAAIGLVQAAADQPVHLSSTSIIATKRRQGGGNGGMLITLNGDPIAAFNQNGAKVIPVHVETNTVRAGVPYLGKQLIRRGVVRSVGHGPNLGYYPQIGKSEPCIHPPRRVEGNECESYPLVQLIVGFQTKVSIVVPYGTLGLFLQGKIVLRQAAS
mmetsp:Transcript_25154/g.54916  ORF Transcript_25154/g.54916 Transcript_25154/m.54916 type:complete len:203 (-) Transcript_25154:588-1196(-)